MDFLTEYGNISHTYTRLGNEWVSVNVTDLNTSFLWSYPNVFGVGQGSPVSPAMAAALSLS